jgi:4-hydroxy-3-methylbut-2-enyl diphosphate reductase
MLVQDADHIDWSKLAGVTSLGVTAGASAPDVLIDQVIEACRKRYEVTMEEITVTSENVQFKLPRALTESLAVV